MPFGLRGRFDVSIVNWAAPCSAGDKSGLGGEVCALSEMADRMSLLRDFFAPLEGLGPGMAGLKNCESLLARRSTKKMIAEGYRVRHFLSIQQALEQGELHNAYWLPGVGNPADGLTKVRIGVVPLARLLESGRRNPGTARPLGGGPAEGQ